MEDEALRESPGPIRHKRRVKKGVRASARVTRSRTEDLEARLRDTVLRDDNGEVSTTQDKACETQTEASELLILVPIKQETENLACSDEEMHAPAIQSGYSPWGITQRILSKQRFVEYDALLEFVSTHRFIQFNVKANRDRIRTAFSSLRVAAPFARTVRFPADVPYVHLENTSIDCWLTQLLQALDLPDRAIERSAGSTGEGGVNDAKRSANVAFNELHRVLCNLESMTSNGVYERASFEEHFSLVWT